MSRRAGPPRPARSILERVLPPGADGRTILGDVHEEHAALSRERGRLRADLWYWRHALALALAYAPRAGRGIEGRAQDARLALRRLAREPGFTAAVVGTLALGIGAGTAVFSVVDGVLLRPLPFPEADRIVRVWAADRARGERFLDATYSDVPAVSRGVSSFAAVTGFSVVPTIFLDGAGENPEDVRVVRVAGDFLGTLGITPVLGRGFSEEELAGGTLVTLITYRLWQERFGGDPDVVGTPHHLDVRPYRIVGVLPPGLAYPEDGDVWRPLRPDETDDDDREVQLLARLSPGAGVPAADAEVASLAAARARELPESHGGLTSWIQPLQTMLVRDVRTALQALLGAVGLVLLIACVNTANLLLARSVRGRHDAAIRTALGASRGRVLSLHLTESLILAALGLAGGLLVGRWVLDSMVALSPELPRLASVRLDLRVVAVMAAVTGVAGVLFGVGPALHAASTAPDRALRDGSGRTSAGRERLAALWSLVTTEIALSTVLVVMAVLLFATFRTVTRHDRGFRPEGLVAIRVDHFHPPTTGDETRAYYARVLERVRALPGVAGVALSSHSILDQRGFRFPVTVEGLPAAPGEEREATIRIAGPELFATAEVPLLAGRIFSAEGGADDDYELVVNRRFAELLGGGAGAVLGRRIGTVGTTGRVVGVVGDVSPALGEPAEPIVYLPFARITAPDMWVNVRTRSDAPALVPELRTRILELGLPVLLSRVDVMEASVRASVAPERFNMLLVGGFALLALALASVGIYGVTAFSVAARRSEIGVRRALGADAPRVALDFVRRAGLLVLAGIALGIAGGALGGRLLESILVGVSPTDPAVLAGVAALLGLVAALATALPLRLALGVEPTEALRSE